MDLQKTVEAIALTEKKVSMALDDIIKMSKKKSSRGKGPSRQPVKKHPFQNGYAIQESSKVKSFIESRSSIRQGLLAQRRSSFGNQFPSTSQAAKRATAVPIRKRAVRWNKESTASTSHKRRNGGKTMDIGKAEMLDQKPRTMDALFAHMKEQRLKTPPQSGNAANGRGFRQQRQVQPRQGRTFTAPRRFR